MPDLHALLAALDSRRTRFFTALADIPDDLRAQTPAPGKWSPLQIGEHLMLVERGMGIITERQIAKGDARRDVGEPSEKSVHGLIEALRTPAPFQMPKGVPAIVPAGQLTLDALQTEWEEAADRWHRIVAEFPPALADVALVHHHIGGPMTTAHALAFLEAHIEHHEHQLARTVRALAPEPEA